MKKTVRYLLGMLMLLALALIAVPQVYAHAAAATEVDVAEIDYQGLYMKVIKNGNSIVYYSTDNKKTWQEVEGTTYSDTVAGGAREYILMDISWASATAEVTIHFKGDKDTKIISVKLPKQNSALKVKFDKVEGDFTFTNYDDATTFMWRKSTDYEWTEVTLPDAKTSATDLSYENFLEQIEKLRTKGAKICIRTGQTDPMTNTAADPGERPSKEVSVTITKRASAPSVKLNITKLTLNTKETMEYLSGNSWVDCDKNMEIEDIASEAFYDTVKNVAGTNVVLQVRTAATEKKPYSCIKLITIYAQAAPPTVGDSNADVVYYRSNDYTILKFNKASKTEVYEYCIVTPDDDSDVLHWKAVKNTKEIKLSEKKAPSGTEIYVRIKGVAEKAAKGIPATLPSAIAEIDLNY